MSSSPTEQLNARRSESASHVGPSTAHPVAMLLW